MSDRIKCVCQACGAKYKLPAEFQGRQARCKQCGATFEIPKLKQSETLEDSVLDWLAEEGQPNEEKVEVARPRIVNLPASSDPPGSRGQGLRQPSGSEKSE